MLGKSARAEIPELSASDREYHELQLHLAAELDELLAKIVRLTTNSVVHIQSERRTPRGKLVEETGSGVVMESSKKQGVFVVSNRHVVDETDLKQISIPPARWVGDSSHPAVDR